jgi:tellurite resistance protein TerC
MEFFASFWRGVPIWIWFTFIAVVLAALAFDLGMLHRHAHEIVVRESLNMSALYIGLGRGGVLDLPPLLRQQLDRPADRGRRHTGRARLDVQLCTTGYLVEKTPALDNVFIISMIFTYFAVTRMYQHRVLSWGILGVIVLRAIMIGLGAALVMQFAWVMYFFAVVLIATGIEIIVMMDKKPDIANNPVLKFMRKHLRVTEQMHGERFWVREPHPKSGKLVLWATPLFLCLVLVEIADLVFAILGLRAPYFALAAVVHRFHYLKYALSLVLIFIGAKIFLGDWMFEGKVPAAVSPSVTVGLLAGGFLYSLWKTSNHKTLPARSAN